MKKILSVLLLSLFFTNTLIAQEEVTPELSDVNSIYVSDILTEEGTFSTGKNVNGTFKISNVSDRIVSGVKYRMELVKILDGTTNYEEGTPPISNLSFEVPSETLAYSPVSNPVSISPGSKTVNFSYQIPQKVPEGRIGFLVQIYVNDLQAKYDFIEIDIRGNRVSMVSSYGNVSVKSPGKKEEYFNAAEGPNIEKNETANIEVLIRSDLGESLSLVPELKIFSGSDSNGKLVNSNKFETINVPSGETTLAYPLKLDMEPGVYTGILDLLDNKGASRTVPVEIRYILDGSKPKIGEISYNTTNLLNDNFLVSVSYLVPSLNFRKNEDGSYKDSRVKKFVDLNGDLDLYNLPQNTDDLSIVEPNYLLEKMSAIVRIKDFNTNTLLKTTSSDFVSSANNVIDLGMIKDTDKVIVEIDLYQDGVLVDTHTDTMDVETTGYKNIFDKIWDQHRKSIAVILLLIAIGLAVVLFKTGRVDKNTSIASVVAIVLIGTSIVSAGNVQARGGGMRTESSYLSGFSVISPQPPAVRIYAPGEVFTFSLDFNFGYCTNNGYELRARVNQPYLSGTGQSGMGGWFGLSPGSYLGKLWPGASIKHESYKSAINVPIQASYTPGTYVFQYEIFIRSGDWGDTELGTVVFQVGEDQCKNPSFPGIQVTVPAGIWQFRDVNGLLVCSSRPPSVLSCSASKNRLMPGESVTYTSRRIDGLKADHTWFKGGSTNVPSAKKDTNVVESSFVNSYPDPGMYLTTVATTDSYGKESVCRIGVTVGDQYLNQTLFLGSAEEDFLQDERNYYTDEDGRRYRLDPSAGEGKIDFDMEGGLTNKTCKIKWNAVNVLKCGLYKNNILSKKLNFSGEEDVEPGTYRIKCIQSRDGTEVVSEEKTCRSNPDFRER